MRHTDDTITALTAAEIASEIGVSPQCVQVTLRKAQHKVAAALLERLGHAVVDLARDAPQRHDDPRAMR